MANRPTRPERSTIRHRLVHGSVVPYDRDEVGFGDLERPVGTMLGEVNDPSTYKHCPVTRLMVSCACKRCGYHQCSCKPGPFAEREARRAADAVKHLSFQEAVEQVVATDAERIREAIRKSPWMKPAEPDPKPEGRVKVGDVVQWAHDPLPRKDYTILGVKPANYGRNLMVYGRSDGGTGGQYLQAYIDDERIILVSQPTPTAGRCALCEKEKWIPEANVCEKHYQEFSASGDATFPAFIARKKAESATLENCTLDQAAAMLVNGRTVEHPYFGEVCFRSFDGVVMWQKPREPWQRGDSCKYTTVEEWRTCWRGIELQTGWRIHQ